MRWRYISPPLQTHYIEIFGVWWFLNPFMIYDTKSYTRNFKGSDLYCNLCRNENLMMPEINFSPFSIETFNGAHKTFCGIIPNENSKENR